MDEEITIINEKTRNEKIKNFFIENKKIKKKPFNLYKIVKILIRELKVILKFGDKHVFKFFLKRDKNLLKHFSNEYNFK